MSLTEDILEGKYIITGYKSDCIMISNKAYTQSVIVSSNMLISPWAINDISQFSEKLAEQIIQLKPEIVLLGTGIKLNLPDPKFIAYFAQQGIGFEAMSTDAACRTYGILTAEGRKTVAALILPEK